MNDNIIYTANIIVYTSVAFSTLYIIIRLIAIFYHFKKDQKAAEAELNATPYTPAQAKEQVEAGRRQSTETALSKSNK